MKSFLQHISVSVVLSFRPCLINMKYVSCHWYGDGEFGEIHMLDSW
jgi:hypothetical protein